MPTILAMSGVKASLYVTKQTQGQVYVPQTRSQLLIEYAQRILMSGIKASLYDTKQTQRNFYNKGSLRMQV